MLRLSESTMENLNNNSFQDGIKKLSHALVELFPEYFSDTGQSEIFIHKSYSNMKQFPAIEDSEIVYWVFLSVIVGKENFYAHPDVAMYLSLEGEGKLRLLFESVPCFL